MNAYEMGFFVGFIFVFVIIAIAYRVSKKAKFGTCNEGFDERQLMERGNAYRWGFMTFLIETMIVSVLEMTESVPEIPAEPGVLGFIMVFIPLIVFAFYSIVHDAFMGMNATGRRAYTLYIVIFVLNLVSSIISIAEGEMIEDGVLTLRVLNLLCAVLFAVILLACFIKNRLSEEAE